MLLRDMGQESVTLRVARHSAWLLWFLPNVQETRTYSTSSSIHWLLVRFSLPPDFADPSVWLSRRFIICWSRNNWSHIMDCVQTLTLWSNKPQALNHCRGFRNESAVIVALGFLISPWNLPPWEYPVVFVATLIPIGSLILFASALKRESP